MRAVRDWFRRLNAGEAVFDFIGKRRRFYWISAVLLLLCVVARRRNARRSVLLTRHFELSSHPP